MGFFQLFFSCFTENVIHLFYIKFSLYWTAARRILRPGYLLRIIRKKKWVILVRPLRGGSFEMSGSRPLRPSDKAEAPPPPLAWTLGQAVRRRRRAWRDQRLDGHVGRVSPVLTLSSAYSSPAGGGRVHRAEGGGGGGGRSQASFRPPSSSRRRQHPRRGVPEEAETPRP